MKHKRSYNEYKKPAPVIDAQVIGTWICIGVILLFLGYVLFAAACDERIENKKKGEGYVI